MKIYVIKIVVRGVSPMVWRRLRIAADTSLAALHFIFQIAQGWGDDHLHQFHIYGKDYGISYEGGIGFPDNPFRIVIDDLAFDTGDRFTYEYNFFEHWLHDIRVEAIHEDSMLKTPFCIKGHYANLKSLQKQLDEMYTYIRNNQMMIPNYGEMRRFGEPVSTAFVESTINEVIARRMAKKQQMQWSRKGAHYLLQTRTAVLNNELQDKFANWYPGCSIDDQRGGKLSAMAA